MARPSRWRRSEDATIDILFGDIVLPGGICGLDVAQQAKQRRPSIRILLASGNALDSLASHGRLGPGAAVLHKPSRTADLVRAVLQVLADKRRRRRIRMVKLPRLLLARRAPSIVRFWSLREARR